MNWRSAYRLDQAVPDLHWRSLTYFDLYRILSALLLVGAGLSLQHHVEVGTYDRPLLVSTGLIYAVSGVLCLVTMRLRRPPFHYQLSLQVGLDVACLTLMMYASGGARSGIGLMLLISLAAAGLIGRGRLVLFYASVATVALLFEEGYQSLGAPDSNPDFLQSGLLSVGYFAVAWLAHNLAARLSVSEHLAAQRGVDLANLAQVNQLVIDEMPHGVLVVDQSGVIRSRNAAAESFLGHAPVIAGAVRLKHYCAELERLLASWKSNPLNQFAMMRSPVSANEMRIRFAPIDGESGDAATGTVVFMEDASHEQARAREVKLAALGRLTANIAHEIRNPLSSMTHAAELLEEGGAADATDVKLFRIIRDNAIRLDRMVKEVLQLNRRDRAQPEAILPEIYLAHYLEEFRTTENVPPEVVSLELDTRTPLFFDRNHLHQVLWNLTRNAYRHCRKQRASVRICLNRAPIQGMLQLDVIDDGPGVDADLQNRLFEPFFTTANQGTGLGLYIARELCEANGATLDYVEVAPGGQFRLLIREAQ